MNPLYKAAILGDSEAARQLLEAGVDVDAREEPEGRTPLMAACMGQQAGPDLVKLLLDHGADPNSVGTRTGDLNRPILTLVSSDPNTNLEKIRLLIGHGANVQYRCPMGYTVAIHAACAGRDDVIDLLLAHGAPIDGESTYGESALSVLSRTGHFRAIANLLAHGADPAPLKWTPLHRSVAIGTVGEIAHLLDTVTDVEATDRWERTAFLMSLHSGDPEKPALLLARGANRHATGRCGKAVMHFPIDQDDSRMLEWLITQGFDINQEDQHGQSGLLYAAQTSAPTCFRFLLEAGAEWDAYREEIIENATHPEIIRTLIERGEDLSALEDCVLRDLIGLDTAPDLSATREQYLEGRFRKYGSANPERMLIPFWDAMVRCGWEASQATKQFEDDSFGRGNPVWCHHRLGMSLTLLPDGRFIQIAGEHEDNYDPDFCIYNEVFIHDGKGNFEILGYPAKVFPPTDFHSATLVDQWIYIIGNLGYPETRKSHRFETPVYRFHIETHAIERVATSGESPGWIYQHQATLANGAIHIRSGKRLTLDPEGNTHIADHDSEFELHLTDLTWRLLP